MKRFLLLLITAMSFSTSTAFAQDCDYSGTTGQLQWCLKSGTLTISGSGAMGDYNTGGAPWYIHRESIITLVIGEDVTKIGSFAFSECGELTSISIPKKVTMIESAAFENCRKVKTLTLIDGSTTLTIASANYYGAYNAFKGCPITDLYIGRNLEVVNGNYNQTFKNITTLETLIIAEGVTTLGRSAFSGCTNLTSVTIPSSFTVIEPSMFYMCSSLPSITIPISIQTIGEYAFSECGELTSISIPKKVTMIESAAFENCRKVKTLTLEDGSTTLTIASANHYGAYNAFKGCPIADLYIGRNLEVVNGNYKQTFKGVTTLKTLTIAEGVTTLGSSAFADCTNLESVTLPNSFTEIESEMFSNCSSLPSITLPGSILSIGSSAFFSCVALVTINSKNPIPPFVGNGYYKAFDGVNKTKCIVNVPSDSRCPYKKAYEWGSFENIIDETTYSCEQGIDNIIESQLSIYPNPTTGELTINNEELKINNVEVFDTYGKNIYSFICLPVCTFTINISDLPIGVYFVKISTEIGEIVRKVLKE